MVILRASFFCRIASFTSIAKYERIADACHLSDKMPQRDVSSWNRLITGYAKTGDLENARLVFDGMPERDVVSWTALISGYDQYGFSSDALKLFSRMVFSGVKPNQVTLVSTLSACARLLSVNQAKQVHAYSIGTGFESSIFAANALINAYAKCGSLEDARQMFDKMPERDVVSWCTMMGGYAENQLGKKAMDLYCKMTKDYVKQNHVSLITVLTTCGSLAALVQGKMVHAQVVRTGFHMNSVVGNAVVDMYTKCGAMREAHRLFDKMFGSDIVSWTTMMVGFVQNGYSEEALKLYKKLLWTDVKPDPFTFASILGACANLIMLELGKQLHAHVIGTGHEMSVSAASSLVTMYSKCGNIDNAAQVFDKINCKNLISWNAMIAGYAHNGNGEEALQLLEMMLETNIKPNHITFLGILSACSHAGLVDEGCYYFDMMRRENNISLTSNHYGCMIDLLGRAGRMYQVEDIVNNMPIEPDASLWQTLLGVCSIHGNVELGERAAKNLIQLEPKNSSAYALMSNVYAAAGRWKDVAKVRKMMKDRGLKTLPGCSWIQVKNWVYTFLAEDTSTPLPEEIYANDNDIEIG
ncbi:pentatricopeptide repeat-containing protein At2g13600 [Cryptomeria japonica]|uniref:pentatricopeptide repeat-containing protein At2g13600 n=1 Tax=Cryptomeria japonica TaxID=3369 RepID=UPI0027DA96A7|nr:pentatricopeptide repeat-containing protein At2g13600 [Cryptomeria japonica]